MALEIKCQGALIPMRTNTPLSSAKSAIEKVVIRNFINEQTSDDKLLWKWKRDFSNKILAENSHMLKPGGPTLMHEVVETNCLQEKGLVK